MFESEHSYYNTFIIYICIAYFIWITQSPFPYISVFVLVCVFHVL